MRRIEDKFFLFGILAIGFIILVILLNGCASYTNKGYASFAVYPNHNEGVEAYWMGITKYKAEISQSMVWRIDAKYLNRFELEINPIFYGGSLWPAGTNTYNIDWILADVHLRPKLYLTENLSLFFDRQEHYNIWDSYGDWYWGTYSNSFGLRYDW